MDLDPSRFLGTYFEECFEGLEVMEAALLRLGSGEQASAIPGLINDVFRAAHSIKGGAHTLGFSELSGFTHQLETLLDEVRAGRRAMTPSVIETLLRAVDALREFMMMARDSGTLDVAGLSRSQAAVEALLAVPPLDAVDAAPMRPTLAPSVPPTSVMAGWHIDFRPHPALFLSGTDPLRIFEVLEALGPLKVEADLAALPSVEALSLDQCYLAWQIRLEAPVPRDEIVAAFLWAEGECELSIEPLAPTPAAVPAQLAVEDEGPSSSPPQGPAPRGEGSSLRITTDKVDTIVNLVGELVIAQAMLHQTAGRLDPVQHESLMVGLAQMERHTRQLQQAVMSIRMLPVDFAFSRFPRLVRDLARQLGKQVNLELVGGHTELDKSVIERMLDPLTHLLRNALDHGLETPHERRLAGKPAIGQLRLAAVHQGGHILIEVADDGRGLDRERLLAEARRSGLSVSESASDADVWNLIFAPGFSTAPAVTDVSGRGVGMDVVKRNIESLGGGIDLQSSPGAGTRFTVRLPLTLAILDGMSVRIGPEMFVIPLSAVVESLLPTEDQVKTLTGDARVLRLREEFLPVVDLCAWFGLSPLPSDRSDDLLVVLEAEGRRVAARVHELVGQQQVVVKSLETHYRRVPGIASGTILGDGRVALILDCAALVRQFCQTPALAA